MTRSEAEMWAEAFAHIGHSTDCPTCHGRWLWKPDDLNAILDAEFARRVLSRPEKRREFLRLLREQGVEVDEMPVPPEYDPTVTP